MKKLSFRPSCLGFFAFAIALGCSSDDGDTTSPTPEAERSPDPGGAAMEAPAPGSGSEPAASTPNMGGTEETVTPSGISEPTTADMAAGAEMSGGLQPALPV